jgi:hypothetical protein
MRKSEVAKKRTIAICHIYIGRFQVAMNDPTCVNVRDSLGDSEENPSDTLIVSSGRREAEPAWRI